MDFTPPKTHLHDILTDPTIPVWKKDLIVRKRNTNRLLFGNLKLTCALSTTSPPPTTSTAAAAAPATHSSKLITSCAGDESSDDYDEFSIGEDSVASASSTELQDFHLLTSNGSQAAAEAAVVEGSADSSSSSSTLQNVPSSVQPDLSDSEQHLVMRLHDTDKKVKLKKQRILNNNHNNKMGEEKIKMKNSSRKLSAPTSTATKEMPFIEEEIKYGPGIVHRLRDRYINMTLREANKSYNKRAPLSSLRRASSLDNILDDCTPKEVPIPPPTNRYTKKVEAKTPAKQDSLKRVRSMETLLSFEGKGAPLVNEDIVIIEQSPPVVSAPRKRTSSGSVPSEDELPPPDTVRQTRQKFEKRVSGGGAAMRPVYKKPTISPKPNLLKTQKENKPSPLPTETPNPPASPTKSTPPIKRSPSPAKIPATTSSSPIKSTRSSSPMKIPTPVTSPLKSVIKPTSSPAKAPPTLVDNPPSPLQIPTPTSPSPPMVNGNTPEELTEENTKLISAKALENIRKNGLSFEINPRTSPNLSHLPGNRTPHVISVQQKPENKTNGDISPRQVGIIRPIPKSTVSEKNLLNTAKSERPTKTDKYVSPPNFSKPMPKVELRPVSPTPKVELRPVSPTPVVETRTQVELRPVVTPTPKAPSELPVQPSTELWGTRKARQEQTTSQCFDFTKKPTKIPDYIENDGLIRTNVVEDQLDGPPSPLREVEVIGGNVLINGRSNLQKLPKSNKQRIKFDDSMTSTFEYPSEASLLMDDPLHSGPPQGHHGHQGAPQGGASSSSSTLADLLPRSTLTQLPSGSGSLASYTPSKLGLGDGDHFQLGVTRSAASTAPAPREGVLYLSDSAGQDESSDYLLTPAQEGDTVVWSSETASDLLF